MRCFFCTHFQEKAHEQDQSQLEFRGSTAGGTGSFKKGLTTRLDAGNVFDNLDSIKNIQSIFSGVWDKITSVFSNAKNVFKEKFDAAVTGIKDAFSGIKVSFNLIEFYGYLSFCAGSLFWISGNTNYQDMKRMAVNPEFALNLYDQAFE